MILQPGVYGKIASVFVLLFIIVVILAFILTFHLSFIESLPLLIVLIPLSINISITYGRTITMSTDGCLVEYFGIKRFYPWSGMKTKRYESYNLLMRLSERGSPYKRGAVFSPHRVRKSLFTKAATRGILSLFPFSHIYVYLLPEGMADIPKSRNPYYYVADEASFRKKMNEWDVVIENDTGDSPMS